MTLVDLEIFDGPRVMVHTGSVTLRVSEEVIKFTRRCGFLRTLLTTHQDGFPGFLLYINLFFFFTVLISVSQNFH